MNAQQPLRLTDFTFVDVTVERIGAGGFGLVFMGPDRLQGGEWTALKTLRPELLALRPDLRNLFLQECLTWAGLWPHANLLPAHSATEINGRVYLRLEYADNGSLRDLLSFDQPFATRLSWAQHIAAGLLALHTPDSEFLRPFPLIHRDLKPENVLVDTLGFAMITDFGLAANIERALAQTPEGIAAFTFIEHLATQAEQTAQIQRGSVLGRRATRTARYHTRTQGQFGTVGAFSDSTRAGVAGLGGVGTIAYMPPEQWVDGGEVGTAADLYAFGLILSELLAGRHGLIDLEADLDEDGWYQLHLSGMPRPLRSGPAEGASQLPIEIEQLYQALLAKRPEDRPTAGQALAVLQQGAVQLGKTPYTLGWFPLTDEQSQARWNDWAATCFRFDRIEDALIRNEHALAIDPHDFGTLHTRGAIVGRLGQLAQKEQKAGQAAESDRPQEEALGWYDRALSAATTESERSMAQNSRAAQLSHMGRYADAEVTYATALAVDSRNGYIWFNRANNGLEWARNAAQAGQDAEALRIYTLAEGYAQEALDQNPLNPTIRSLLTTIQQERTRLGA